MATKRKTQLLMALSVLGCFLFLCSTVFPFLLENHPAEFWFASDDVSYWSFKSSTQHMGLETPIGPAVESWFYYYWAKIRSYGTGFLPVFASMFIAQILTLITGMASVFIKRRYFVLVPVASCAMTVSSMTYVIVSRKDWFDSQQGLKGWWNSQPGYWLAFPSLCVFLSVLILSYVWKT